MATPKHSGFEAPVIGSVVPDGAKFKKNPDGTYTIVEPKKKPVKKETKKTTKKK